MELYRTALFASDLAWWDILSFKGAYGARDLADQLYRAVCSVSANVAEGYSRSSGKDRRRFYEHALGYARESRDWYFKVRHITGDAVFTHRTELHTSLIKQLLFLIPKQTDYSIREASAMYTVESASIINAAKSPESAFDLAATIPFSDPANNV